LMAAEDRVAEGVDVPFMQAKIATARFYGDHILNRATAMRDSIVDGADSVTSLALESF
jgi:3-(methylthio)propanoyl-CoA dehydrogenase